MQRMCYGERKEGKEMCGGMRKRRKILKGGKQKKSGIVGEMSKVDMSTRRLGVQQRWKRLRVSCM